jgi:hypothetical protein
MPVTLTDINVGTVPGDATGDTARVGGQAINTNNATLEAAVADIADAETISGLWNFQASGVGGFTNYDVTVGDVVTPDYGIVRIGNSIIGRTNNITGYNLDGAFITKNVGGPVTGDIEWAVIDSGNLVRFALPKSTAGNATYNPRSMLIAGPAVADSDIVTIAYWDTAGTFDQTRIPCNTAVNGADLGVQNNVEIGGDAWVNGTFYTDIINEETAAAGVTIDGVLIKDGAVDGVDVSAHDADTTIHYTKASILLDDLGDVTETTITSGDLLRWNGSAWVNYADSNYATSGHTHTLAQGATDVTATAAELNILDLSATTPAAGWVYASDGGGPTSASWRQLLGSEISNTEGWTANAGTVTDVTGGTGIASTGGATPSLSLTVDELSENGINLTATDRLVGTSGTTNFAQTISTIPLSIFSNDSNWTSISVLDDIGDVTETSITTGDLLRWNGSAWVNYADSNYAASGHTHTEADITLAASDRLVGRDTAGGGAAEELTVSGGIEFTGSGGIQRSALTGDVTATAGSNTTALAADVVDLAELAHATQGDILYWGASGVPARLGNGTSGQVLTTNGAAANPSWEDATGGGLTATYKVANYTAVAGDFVIIDLGGTARTVTLPATIAAGDRVAVHVLNTSATVVSCTIARNSKTIRFMGDTNGKAGGTADDITLDDGETIELIATDTTNWNIV